MEFGITVENIKDRLNELNSSEHLTPQIKFPEPGSYSIGAHLYYMLFRNPKISEKEINTAEESDTVSTMNSSFDSLAEGSPLLNLVTLQPLDKKTSGDIISNCKPKRRNLPFKYFEENYTICYLLGEGSQGSVYLCKDKLIETKYALKVYNKEALAKRNKLDDVNTEIEVLQTTDSPFILKFLNSYECETKIYLLLEFCQGGDLFHYLNKVRASKRQRFSEKTARFYAAWIVLGLKELHDRDIIYRDLKPENILMDKAGYPKLCDFGLCVNTKKVTHKTYTRQWGSREYFAPEITQRKDFNQSVDWWCLGILLYELFEGKTPFEHANVFTQLNNIRSKEVKFSDSWRLSEDWKGIIRKLLTKEPSQRLGYNSTREVMNHPWFKSVNWDKLSSKEIVAPLNPKVNLFYETLNFDTLVNR